MTCDDVRWLGARCVAGSHLWVAVRMQDNSFDGQEVTVSVNGDPQTLTINNRRALYLRRATSDMYTVVLEDPAGCFAAREVSCEPPL